MRSKLVWLTLVLVIASSVAAAPRRRAVTIRPPVEPLVRDFAFDFSEGVRGWEAGYSDYGLETADMRVVTDMRLLPPEIGSRTAWYLSGWNYADDLFLFLRRRLAPADGIVPYQNYVVSYRVTFASNAGRECGGIGGAPGESVFIKVGASPIEPRSMLYGDYVGMSVDKGNQSQGGVHASTAGTISVEGHPCDGHAPFVSLTRDHTHPYAVPASAAGELWLLAGFDSGFEGFSAIYVERIEVTLEPVPSSDLRTSWQVANAEIASIVTDLRSGGVVIPLTPWAGRWNQHIAAREIGYAVNEPGTIQEIVFFAFDTSEAARAATALISTNGRRVGGAEMNWSSPPHFFLGDRVIVAYAGSSSVALSVLTQRFGSQFAGE